MDFFLQKFAKTNKMTKFVMKYFVMKNLLKSKRVLLGLKVKDLAFKMNIDQALISKFESGLRFPTEKQIRDLSSHLEIPLDDLMKLWLKEKIFSEIKEYKIAEETLSLVMEEIAKYNVLHTKEIPNSIQEILDEIDFHKSILNQKREFDSFRIVEALELEYTFESNRIEGNTLNLRETDLIVNQGLTISGKSMREHLEVINHKEAIDYIKLLIDKKSEFNEYELLTIHNLILRGINPEYAGKYRNVQVMIQGSLHTPTQAFMVSKEMEDYFIWYSRNKNLHPVILAAELHERLVTIHPFIDGNGRTSRLIMNLFLLKHGFVIANIKGDYDTRMKYYQTLENAQTNNDKNSFIEFIAKVELESLKRYISILG